MTKPFVIFVMRDASPEEAESNRQFFEEHGDTFPFESLIVEGDVDVHILPDASTVEVRYINQALTEADVV